MTLCRELNLPTYSDGESSFSKVSAFDDGHLSSEKGAWPIKYFMRMAMVPAVVSVRMVVVRMRSHCNVFRQ
jgi:hypothetical protein